MSRHYPIMVQLLIDLLAINLSYLDSKQMIPQTSEATAFLSFDPTRIVPRFRKLSKTASLTIISSVMQMPEEQVVADLNHLLRSFSIQYRNITRVFEKHFEQISPLIQELDIEVGELSYSRKSLLGAYFTQESAIESSAFFNPCMIAAPDQSELLPTEQRVILSFNAIGEGNQTSVVFRTGIIDHKNKLHPEKPGSMPEEGKIRQKKTFRKELLVRGLSYINGHYSTDEINDLLSHLDEDFTPVSLNEVLEKTMEDDPKIAGLARLVHSVASPEYEIEFSLDSDISERVLLPGPDQKGIENINFVEIEETGNDEPVYYGIYTSKTDQGLVYKQITTIDFYHFKVKPFLCPIRDFTHFSLFPRKINGRYSVLASREDGIYHSFSDHPDAFRDFEKIMGPEYAWELASLAHAGTPLETPDGWLILTQAIGAMGKRALGAALISRKKPSRVLARAAKPVFQVYDLNRTGLPGQGITSSGALLHNHLVMIPYSTSNHTSSVASFVVDDLISELHEIQ